MKHKLSIITLLIGMFLVTQFIGLYVVNTYSPNVQDFFNPETGENVSVNLGNELPYGLEMTEEEADIGFGSLIISLFIAFALIFLLMKFRWNWLIRIWFLFVVAMALSISINSFLIGATASAANIALGFGIALAILKIFRPDVIIHNVTELLIYPGIAAIFVPILDPTSVIALLVVISIYDMWAVWKSKIMLKMVKYQMEEVKVFGGFMIPTVSQKIKKQIENLKKKYKGKKVPAKIQKKKFKMNLAILGGGDVIFPIITAGVFMRSFGLASAIAVIIGALAGLIFLYSISKKDKAYPAMPYISVGIFLGLVFWRIFLF